MPSSFKTTSNPSHKSLDPSSFRTHPAVPLSCSQRSQRARPSPPQPGTLRPAHSPTRRPSDAVPAIAEVMRVLQWVLGLKWGGGKPPTSLLQELTESVSPLPAGRLQRCPSPRSRHALAPHCGPGAGAKGAQDGRAAMPPHLPPTQRRLLHLIGLASSPFRLPDLDLPAGWLAKQ